MTELDVTPGGVLVSRGASPAGLPYPESSAATGAGANDIKALALAVDSMFASPWVPAPPAAGFTGAPQVRKEGAYVSMVGVLTGTFTGGPTVMTLPVGYRPVFPAGSGLTYYGLMVAASQSGNPGSVSFRVWGSGAVVVVGVNGTIPSVDLSSMRWPVR